MDVTMRAVGGRRLAHWFGLSLILAVFGGELAFAQTLRIRDICRIKGQEENTLHGMGLVVGLKGTGDTDGPTLRALAKMLESMGSPLGPPGRGQSITDELKNAKNVAMVMVTAVIPPEGARQGEPLHCTVSAVSAKSLQGGVLVMTPLVGPRPGNPRIYALAQGSIALSESGPPTVGIVHNGCRLEEDFHYRFWDDQRWVTLVIDRHHAGFPTAYEIKEALSGQGSIRKPVDGFSSRSSTRGSLSEVQAVDPANVRIRIPDEYADHEVDFIAQVLDTQVALQHHDATVVINERNGVIVIGDNVMIGRVAVTHKNVSIQTGDDPARGPLLEVDQNSDSPTSATRLKALVNALNALKVDSQSIIDIIKSLERSGDLYGRLIIE
jgi:flagellar P-ring protein precursor FlgI